MGLLLEVFHELFREGDVTEHVGDLVHDVVPALNLELGNHALLCFIRDTSVVQETP